MSVPPLSVNGITKQTSVVRAQTEPRRVLSVQSHVCSGYVGASSVHRACSFSRRMDMLGCMEGEFTSSGLLGRPEATAHDNFLLEPSSLSLTRAYPSIRSRPSHSHKPLTNSPSFDLSRPFNPRPCLITKGNKAATFPLQLLEWDVDVVNTVQFSNHTGPWTSGLFSPLSESIASVFPLSSSH